MILRSFIYLRIQHERKVYWDLWYPLLAAIVFVMMQTIVGLDLTLVGSDGVLRQVNGLLGVLSGFYIASLTAVAAIQSPGLSQLMAGDAPELEVVKNKRTYRKKLTRGEFLRFLFGYLAVASILLFFVGILIDSFYAPALARFPVVAQHLQWIGAIVLFTYVFALANIMTNTLVGVYYLSDRMHRIDEKGEVEKIDGIDTDSGE